MSNNNKKRGANDAKMGDKGDAELDLFSLLPVGKVKANLQINKDVGTVRKPAEKFLDCCAALFLQTLIQDTSAAKEISDTTSAPAATAVIQLEHIQAAAANRTKYEFLMDDLQQVEDSTAPKAARLLQQAKRAKKRRLVSSVSDSTVATKLPMAQLAQVQQVMDQQQDESKSNHVGTNLEVIEDEDEYD